MFHIDERADLGRQVIFQRRLAAIRDTLDTLDKSIEQGEKSAQLIFDLAAIVEQQTQQRALDRLFQMFCYLAATKTDSVRVLSVNPSQTPPM